MISNFKYKWPPRVWAAAYQTIKGEEQIETFNFEIMIKSPHGRTWKHITLWFTQIAFIMCMHLTEQLIPAKYFIFAQQHKSSASA